METQGTIIYGVTPDKLQSLFDGIDSRLSAIESKVETPNKDELITRAATAKMLDVDLSTLHLWAKRGKLVPVGIAGRVYYRRSAIEAALTPLTVSK